MVDLDAPFDFVGKWMWGWSAWRWWRRRKAYRRMWVLDLGQRFGGVLARF